MALRRGCSLSSEELELRRDDLLNPRNYAVQCAGRDVAIEPQDFDEALLTLGTAPREQFEQVWPSLDAMIVAVLEAGKKRRIAESKTRSLGDGRRPGESDIERFKREAAEDPGDPEGYAEHVARMNARLAAKKPTQTPVSSTAPPPAQTTAPRSSVGDMRPDSCDAFVTLLETLNYDELDAAQRTLATIRCDGDRAVVARALNAMWEHKGKTARNLLVLVKGEKAV